MFYHYGLRGYLDYSFIEQIGRDGFKPPLWYGGVPLLFSWRDTLSDLDFLLVNAIALLFACWAVWLLGRKLGGELGAGLAVLCLCALPGSAGGSTLIGVEMTQVAFFAWLMLLLVHVRERTDSARGPFLFGVLFGLGMLAKWTLVIYLVLPIGWTIWSLRGAIGTPGSSVRHFLAALLLSAVMFLAWLVPFADLEAIVQGATDEATYDSIWSAGSLLFYPRMVMGSTVGLAAAPVVALALLGALAAWRSGAARGDRAGLLMHLGAAVVSSLALLTLLPHKEIRYIEPLLPALALLMAWGLAIAVRSGGRIGRLAVVAACSWLVLSTLVIPWTERPPESVDGNLPFEPLRFTPRVDDYGLEFTVRDESLREGGFATVTYSVAGEAALPVLVSLQWELYGRNEVPVVSRYNHGAVTEDSCRFDLVRSSHFLTNRVLSAEEVDTITTLGFELQSQSSPRIEEFGALQLWRRVGRWE